MKICVHHNVHHQFQKTQSMLSNVFIITTHSHHIISHATLDQYYTTMILFVVHIAMLPTCGQTIKTSSFNMWKRENCKGNYIATSSVFRKDVTTVRDVVTCVTGWFWIWWYKENVHLKIYDQSWKIVGCWKYRMDHWLF